jgi:hypothetical protein
MLGLDRRGISQKGLAATTWVEGAGSVARLVPPGRPGQFLAQDSQVSSQRAFPIVFPQKGKGFLTSSL